MPLTGDIMKFRTSCPNNLKCVKLHVHLDSLVVYNSAQAGWSCVAVGYIQADCESSKSPPYDSSQHLLKLGSETEGCSVNNAQSWWWQSIRSLKWQQECTLDQVTRDIRIWTTSITLFIFQSMWPCIYMHIYTSLQVKTNFIGDQKSRISVDQSRLRSVKAGDRLPYLKLALIVCMTL